MPFYHQALSIYGIYLPEFENIHAEGFPRSASATKFYLLIIAFVTVPAISISASRAIKKGSCLLNAPEAEKKMRSKLRTLQ